MDLLHGLAADGAEAGTVVVAGEQTGGRGSRGRGWRSPPGGLWLSALFRPRASAGVELFGLRIGLAVADAIEALGPGVPVDIKWPNDLMVGDRKLGGILCEARWQGEALAWVVAGVGINVANAIPAELAGIATALAERLPGDHSRRWSSRRSRRGSARSTPARSDSDPRSWPVCGTGTGSTAGGCAAPRPAGRPASPRRAPCSCAPTAAPPSPSGREPSSWPTTP